MQFLDGGILFQELKTREYPFCKDGTNSVYYNFY